MNFSLFTPWAANVAVARTRVRVWEGQSWQNVENHEKSVFNEKSYFFRKSVIFLKLVKIMKISDFHGFEPQKHQ